MIDSYSALQLLLIISQSISTISISVLYRINKVAPFQRTVFSNIRIDKSSNSVIKCIQEMSFTTVQFYSSGSLVSFFIHFLYARLQKDFLSNLHQFCKWITFQLPFEPETHLVRSQHRKCFRFLAV